MYLDHVGSLGFVDSVHHAKRDADDRDEGDDPAQGLRPPRVGVACHRQGPVLDHAEDEDTLKHKVHCMRSLLNEKFTE